MMVHAELLANLIKRRNAIDAEISAVIGRPALSGHIGEFIASHVFGIDLEKSANAKHMDGRFAIGPLEGKTVNIKWYLKMESVLDLHPTGGPDYYLVLAGPKGSATSSRGSTRPMLIESVYLFETSLLLASLKARDVQIGTGSSVIKSLWEASEVYPTKRNPALILTDEQCHTLGLFSGAALTLST